MVNEIQLNQKCVKIAVGSSNKDKIRAVQMACDKFLSRYDILSFNVDSQVSPQPMTDIETMEGAMNRAKNALKLCENADFGIGLEGGVQKIGTRWFECGWIAITDRQGKIGLGSSGRFELSKKIVDRLLSGSEELAHVIYDLSKDLHNNYNSSAMGLITNGKLSRDSAYSHGVLFAFGPFLSAECLWDDC